MSDWQPIETAPKDGRAIFVSVAQWITVAAWHRTYKTWVSNGPVYSPYLAGEQPEYWLPMDALPEPPQ